MAGAFTSLGSVLDLTTEGSSSLSDDYICGQQKWLALKRRVVTFSRNFCTRQTLLVMSLGQVASLLLCSSGVFSELLQEKGVSMPAAQCLTVYIALTASYTMQISLRREGNIITIMKERGWKYFLIAICDVEAHYTLVKAYQYTTVMNVQLLCCFAIPVVLIISKYAMRVQYGVVHLAGVLISLAGVMTLVGTDFVYSHGTVNASDLILGDLLVVLSATLYGVTDLFCEFVSKKFDTQEFMGMVGLFGTVICGIQMFALEHEQIVNTAYTYDTVLYLVGFCAVAFSLYVLYSYALTKMNAAALNLNLLCTDFYAMLAGMIIFHNTVHPLTYLAFFLIIVGVIIYYTKPTKVKLKSKKSKRPCAGIENSDGKAEDIAVVCSANGEDAQASLIELAEVVVVHLQKSHSTTDWVTEQTAPDRGTRSAVMPVAHAFVPADVETESGLGADEEVGDGENIRSPARLAADNDSDCGGSSLGSRCWPQATGDDTVPTDEAAEAEPLLQRLSQQQQVVSSV